ncbi:MAG: transporter [Phycisphaerales bacterium]
MNAAHRRVPIVIGSTCAFALGCDAAFAGPPYLTDDTETPAAGIVEMDITFAYVRYLRGGSYINTPILQLDYSPTDNIQPGFSVPWTTLLGNNGTEAATGIGDLDLSCKWRFLDDDPKTWVPAISVTPDLTCPTGDADRGLGSGTWKFAVPFEFEKSFGDDGQNWVFAEVGLRKWFDGDASVQMFYGAAIGRNFTSEWSAGIELNGNHFVSSNPAQVLAVNGVVEYSPSSTCTIGLGVGYSILSSFGPRPFYQLNIQCFF